MGTSVNIFRNSGSSSSSGGGGGGQTIVSAVGKAVWSVEDGVFTKLVVANTLNRYVCILSEQTQVVVTIDENEPSQDLTNVLCATKIYPIDGSALLTMFSVNGETKEINIYYQGIIN